MDVKAQRSVLITSMINFCFNKDFPAEDFEKIQQGAGDQIIAQELGNGAHESASGYLHLFNPSSTTFVKHYMGLTEYYQNFGNTGPFQVYYAGYCNVTAAIDGVIFKMSSGNIDSGTIKLYGIT